MTENTIRCTNCGLEFESDYDLEQNLIDPETGEIHDGCPTCKTDAYLMDLIKYPDQELQPMTEIQRIEIHEIRKLLDAVQVLAVRPAQADENTLGQAIGYFKKLINDRTNGQIQIVLVVDGVILDD